MWPTRFLLFIFLISFSASIFVSLIFMEDDQNDSDLASHFLSLRHSFLPITSKPVKADKNVSDHHNNGRSNNGMASPTITEGPLTRFLFGDLEAERLAMERTIMEWRATQNNTDLPPQHQSHHQPYVHMEPTTPLVLTDKLSRNDATVLLGIYYHHNTTTASSPSTVLSSSVRYADSPSSYFLLTIGHAHTVIQDTHPRVFAGVVQRFIRPAADFFTVASNHIPSSYRQLVHGDWQPIMRDVLPGEMGLLAATIDGVWTTASYELCGDHDGLIYCSYHLRVYHFDIDQDQPVVHIDISLNTLIPLTALTIANTPTPRMARIYYAWEKDAYIFRTIDVWMIPANTTVNTTNDTSINEDAPTPTDNVDQTDHTAASSNATDSVPLHLRTLGWRLGVTGARAVKYGTPSRTSALLPLAPLLGTQVSVNAPPSAWTHERVLAVELNCEKQTCAYGAHIHTRLAGVRRKPGAHHHHNHHQHHDEHELVTGAQSNTATTAASSSEAPTSSRSSSNDHENANDEVMTAQSLLMDMMEEFLISEGVSPSLFGDDSNDNDEAAYGGTPSSPSLPKRTTTATKQDSSFSNDVSSTDGLTTAQLDAIQSPDDEPWILSQMVTDYATVRSIHAKAGANQPVLVASSTMGEEGIWSTYPYLIPLDADRRFDPIEMINLGSGTTFIDVAMNTAGNLIATLDSRNVILILEKVAYLGLDDDDLAWEVALKLTMPAKLKNYPPIKLQLIDAYRRGTRHREETTFLAVILQHGVLVTYDLAGRDISSSMNDDTLPDALAPHWEILLGLLTIMFFLRSSLLRMDRFGAVLRNMFGNNTGGGNGNNGGGVGAPAAAAAAPATATPVIPIGVPIAAMGGAARFFPGVIPTAVAANTVAAEAAAIAPPRAVVAPSLTSAPVAVAIPSSTTTQPNITSVHVNPSVATSTVTAGSSGMIVTTPESPSFASSLAHWDEKSSPSSASHHGGTRATVSTTSSSSFPSHELSHHIHSEPTSASSASASLSSTPVSLSSHQSSSPSSSPSTDQ